LTLTDYQQLGARLTWDDPAVLELFGQVQGEAQSNEPLDLTGLYNADDSRPPYLTPVMHRWYLRHVPRTRGPALQEIRGSFAAIELGKGQRGFLLESERDRIEREKNAEIEKERDRYFLDKDVQDTGKDLDEAREVYEQAKAENGGQDANEWSPIAYCVFLTVLAIPEFPLNFQSLMSFFSTVPILAVILALVIAGGIWFSSHIVGTTIKQWGELFGGHVPQRDKMRAGRYLSIGILLFIGAMCLVYFPRSYLFRAAIERKIVLGEPVLFSDYMGMLVSVGGNFLLWLIGVGVAYVAHSHVPEFGAKQRRYNRLKKKVLASYERELQHRKDRHISKAQKDQSNLTQLEARQLKNRPDYLRARSLFEELRKVDNAVLAILEEYRGRLVETAKASDHVLIFKMDDINSVTENKQVKIDSSTYLQLKLRLPYA
jgi:hypothetical protein